jgi:hypothetical protein
MSLTQVVTWDETGKLTRTKDFLSSPTHWHSLSYLFPAGEKVNDVALDWHSEYVTSDFISGSMGAFVVTTTDTSLKIYSVANLQADPTATWCQTYTMGDSSVSGSARIAVSKEVAGFVVVHWCERTKCMVGRSTNGGLNWGAAVQVGTTFPANPLNDNAECGLAIEGEQQLCSGHNGTAYQVYRAATKTSSFTPLGGTSLSNPTPFSSLQVDTQGNLYVAAPNRYGLSASTVKLAVWMIRDYSTDAASLYTTTDGINYTETTLASLGLSGLFKQAVVDPWSPRYISGSGPVNGWILSNNEVRRIEDVDGSPTLGAAFNLGRISSDVFKASIHTHIAQRNFVVVQVLIWNDTVPSRNGHYIYRTTDGENWSGGKISSNWGGYGFYISTIDSDGGVWVSAHTAGVVISNDLGPTPSAGKPRLLRSDDHGQTFSVLWTSSGVDPDGHGEPVGYGIEGIHVPYHNNSDDGIIYFCQRAWSGQFITFKYDHGTVTRLATPPAFGMAESGFDGVFTLDSFVEDRNKLRGTMEREVQPSGAPLAGLPGQSNNGGTSWTSTGAGVFGGWARGIAIAGDNLNTQWRWGVNGLLEKTVDDGANWTDVSGDLPGEVGGTNINRVAGIWGL